MATVLVPEIGARPGAVAPWRHTAILLGFFVLTAAAGAARHGRAPAGTLVAQRPGVALLYLSLLAGEWGLVYYVWKGGLRPRGVTLRELVGGRWAGPRAVFLDVLLASAIWILWQGLAFAWMRWSGPGSAASIAPLLPQGMAEAGLWVLLSVSAGISEEIVFRGYLQRQFMAYTGSTPLALFLQVAVFAAAHLYQGVGAALGIAVYGALFTLLALWRKSLRPGMIAHAWTDIAGGLLG